MERPLLQVVVDTNVLISAAISRDGIPRRILDTWHAGIFEMVVSYDLLHELESVLMRPHFLDRLTRSDVLAYVEWLGEEADLGPSSGDETPGFSADPNDDYLVELALAVGANFVVSGDEHLLQIPEERLLQASDPPLSVVTPRAFWDDVLMPLL